MPKRKKPEAKKRGRGRPSKFDEALCDRARKLCLLGATDKELADFFEIGETTLNRWKNEHPEFREAIQKGRAVADAEVAEKLYHRALGYSHPEVHVSNYQGEVTLTPLTKHYPPDTAAAFIWLKNRQSAKWRDQPHNGAGSASAAELLKAIADKLPN